MDAQTTAKSTNRQLAGRIAPEKGDREIEKLQKELRKEQDIKYELPRSVECEEALLISSTQNHCRDALERSTAEMSQTARALEKETQDLTEGN